MILFHCSFSLGQIIGAKLHGFTLSEFSPDDTEPKNVLGLNKKFKFKCAHNSQQVKRARKMKNDANWAVEEIEIISPWTPTYNYLIRRRELTSK